MDKQQVLKQLIDKVKREIAQAEQNYNSTKQLTQSSDFKAESKWDTRSTEAGYLASAQKQRLEELKVEQSLLEEVDTTSIDPTHPITMGALVKILHNSLERFYFLASSAGGTALKVDETTLLVISVFSPIGKAILGLSSGDEFEIEHNGNIREYTIISVS